ncbi:MAG: O-antigen ligase [Granulosicoccus sp.]
MRVATYTQPVAATRGSVAAVFILVLTILFGTSVLPTIVQHFSPTLVAPLTNVWFLIYLLAFLGLMFQHGINWISWLVRYRILLVILLLGSILSVAWSIDARVSAERTVHLLGSSLIAIYLGFTIPLMTILRVFAAVLAAIVLGSIAAALFLPELGIESYEGSRVWRGLFNSKNDLGFWAAIGVLLYVTLSDSTHSLFLRFSCVLLAGLCLGLLGFSQSATSLLAMLVAGTLSLYLYIASRFQLGFVQMVVLAVLFTGLVGMAIVNIDTFGLIGRTDDLTGRGEVWRQTWQLIMNRPATGYGYGALWFPNDSTLWIQQSLTDFSWVVFHAHNGFLQVASEIGLPLSVIALLMVAQQLIEILYCQYQRQQVGVLFVLAFVVAYLISNFSEARFLVTRELFWIFFLTLPISMLRQINLTSEEISAQDEYSDFPDDSDSELAVAHAADKPWLRPAITATAASLTSSARPAIVTEGGHAISDSEYLDETDWGDGSMNELINTLSLTETDIDLGEFVDTDVSGESTNKDVESSTNDTLDLTNAEDERLYADSRSSDEALFVDFDDIDEPVLAPSVGTDRFNEFDNEDSDPYDKSFDDSGGEWIDISLGDGAK